MRLVPRSLLGRLILVLLTGLVIAELVSFAIHTRERGQLLSQVTGMRSAQRIADIVRLLEPLTPAERRKMVDILSAPPMTISLDRGPIATVEAERDKNARALLFSAMLRRFLGNEWPAVVTVSENVAPPFQPGPMHGAKGMAMREGWMPMNPAMHSDMQTGLLFVAQVRLSDGTLVTFDTHEPREATDWPYRVLLSLAVLLAAVIGVSLIAVRWATRPLNALADAADELGKNINRPPLKETGPLEVTRAARAFNSMQARLAGYIRERTRILAAMSHDLKTPITRLRLRSELLDDAQLRARFTRDLEEMESMVAATLGFLRGLESGEAAEPVDIMALLESLQADILETGGQVTIEGSAQRPYRGQTQALKRCLSNLLENAIQYGKSARVVVEDGEHALRLRIQDQGPGIPPADLERVFEPFCRLEGSRSRTTGGTGLGLTIARSVAEAHNGQLTLRNREEGGLEACLTLPRTTVPAASSGERRRG